MSEREGVSANSDDHGQAYTDALKMRLRLAVWRLCWDSSNLTKGVPETLAGFCQLALEGVNLFRNILKLFLGKRASPDDLMSFAVRFAQRASDFRCDLIELALLSHSRLLR